MSNESKCVKAKSFVFFEEYWREYLPSGWANYSVTEIPFFSNAMGDIEGVIIKMPDHKTDLVDGVDDATLKLLAPPEMLRLIGQALIDIADSKKQSREVFGDDIEICLRGADLEVDNE